MLIDDKEKYLLSFWPPNRMYLSRIFHQTNFNDHLKVNLRKLQL